MKACSHSPARSAAPLVFDGRCVDSSPVDRGCRCGAHHLRSKRHESSACLQIHRRLRSKVGRLELRIREVGEDSHTEHSATICSSLIFVQFVDIEQRLLENGKSLPRLCSGWVLRKNQTEHEALEVTDKRSLVARKYVVIICHLAVGFYLDTFEETHLLLEW